MMLKFSLKVSSDTYEGFKLSVSADDEKSIKIAEELTKQLIAKIDKISVKISNN